MKRLLHERMKKKASGGYSLLEMAVVILVAGLMLGGVWVIAKRGWNYSQLQQAKEDVILTVANTRAYFSGQAGLSESVGMAATTDAAIKQGIIPTNLIRSALCGGSKCADNPMSTNDAAGTFRVCSYPLGSAGNCSVGGPGAAGSFSEFFGVELSGLSQQQCIAIAEQIGGPAGPSGLVDVAINGVNVRNSVANDVVTTNCTARANGIDVVTFVYRVSAPAN